MGQLVGQETATHDDNGNRIADATFRLYYDLFDRLVRVERVSDGVTVGRYRYDAAGRRVHKRFDNPAVAGAGLDDELFFVCDGAREIEELDALGALRADYVWGGQFIDQVVQMRRVNGAVTEEYYTHASSIFSVAALTDASGAVVERYRYTSIYGAHQVLDGGGGARAPPDEINPWRFQGRRWDPETGFYYFRQRYLDPALGRFVSRDPLGLWGDPGNRGNAYAFCGNDPVNRVDPWGLSHGAAMAQLAEWKKAYDVSWAALASTVVIPKLPKGCPDPATFPVPPGSAPLPRFDPLADLWPKGHFLNRETGQEMAWDMCPVVGTYRAHQRWLDAFQLLMRYPNDPVVRRAEREAALGVGISLLGDILIFAPAVGELGPALRSVEVGAGTTARTAALPLAPLGATSGPMAAEGEELAQAVRYTIQIMGAREGDCGRAVVAVDRMLRVGARPVMGSSTVKQAQLAGALRAAGAEVSSTVLRDVPKGTVLQAMAEQKAGTTMVLRWETPRAVPGGFVVENHAVNVLVGEGRLSFFDATVSSGGTALPDIATWEIIVTSLPR